MTDALVYSAIVLTVVQLSDLGRRRVSLLRVIHPLFTAGIVMGLFVKAPPGGSADVVLQVCSAALGALLGLIAAGTLMRVERDTGTRRNYTVAGAGYAVFWIVVMGLRVAFAYGAEHIFTASLVHFMTRHHLHQNALTDALIYIPLAMLLVRTATIGARRRALKGRQVAAAVPAGNPRIGRQP